MPAHTGRDAPPKKPAKNLKIHSAVMLGAKPAPRVKSALIGTEVRYVPSRPMVSLIGALSMGPKDKPSTYVVRGKIATISETLKSSITSGTPGAYTELPKALTSRLVSICAVQRMLIVLTQRSR